MTVDLFVLSVAERLKHQKNSQKHVENQTNLYKIPINSKHKLFK